GAGGRDRRAPGGSAHDHVPGPGREQRRRPRRRAARCGGRARGRAPRRTRRTSRARALLPRRHPRLRQGPPGGARRGVREEGHLRLTRPRPFFVDWWLLCNHQSTENGDGVPYDRLPMADRITRDDVVHVATLARLRVSDEELDMFTGQLAAVLAHAEDVASLDTAGVPPTAHPLPLENV